MRTCQMYKKKIETLTTEVEKLSSELTKALQSIEQLKQFIIFKQGQLQLLKELQTESEKSEPATKE